MSQNKNQSAPQQNQKAAPAVKPVVQAQNQLAQVANPTKPTIPKIKKLKKITFDPNKSKTFQEYIALLRELDNDLPKTSEYGSILILGLMEEVGEIARAYLAEHGRKPTNKAAQRDETYKQELGDLLISIMRLAIHKNINLDHRIHYTIKKIQRRRTKPKE